MSTNIEKTKVLITNVLASSIRDLFPQHDKAVLALQSGCSKFNLLKSPRPKMAPKYFTGAFLTIIPATLSCGTAVASNAMVLSRFKVSPVKQPTNSMWCKTMANCDKSGRKIAVSSAHNKQGSFRKCYHSKNPSSLKEYIKTWPTRLKRWYDRGQPCLMPRHKQMGSVSQLLCLTTECAFVYKRVIQATNSGGKPIWDKRVKRKRWLTLSNVFLKSKNKTIPPSDTEFEITSCTDHMFVPIN